MQNKDKLKLKRQLEQEAKKLVDIDGNELVISLISTCNALLKISEKTLDENGFKAIHAQAVKYKSEWAEKYGLGLEVGGEVYDGSKIV